VQPVFNRDVIASLADSALSSLHDLESWINGDAFIGLGGDKLNESSESAGSQTTLTNLESELIAAVTHQNHTIASNLVSQLSSYAEEEKRTTVTNVFLRSISEGSVDMLKFLLDTKLVDIGRTDEITDRGCLHEAAIASRLDVIQICIGHGILYCDYSNVQVPT
jgi:CDK inhibitor PHO81